MTFSKREYREGFGGGWGSYFSIQGFDGPLNIVETVQEEFRFDELIPEPEYVYAEYEREDYSGSALLIYKTSEGWFLVSGSHCSCYGLEECWKPEPFDPTLHLEALKKDKRLFYSSYNNDYVDRWLEWAVSN